MRCLTKRFPAVVLAGGLALAGAACEDTGSTDDPAVDQIAPTEEVTDPLTPTETES